MRILIVEDDTNIGENLVQILRREGYAVDLAINIKLGENKIIGGEYDGIICDRRLPGGDGLNLISMIRKVGINTPVMMLTARNLQADIVEGLDMGADDYLAKPFSKDILLARLRALLRRRKKIIQKSILRFGKLSIDTGSREVKFNEKLISLAPKEYEVLLYLAEHPGDVVERVNILTHVWNDEVDLFSNTVDVHIRYLRKKLGNEVIKTVRGKGYLLCNNLD